MWAEIPTLPSLPIDQTLVNRQIPIFAIQQILGYLDLLKAPDAWEGAENDVLTAIEGIEESIALLMEDYAGGATMPIYESAWFAVGSYSQVTLTHSLGKLPQFVQVWASRYSDGSGEKYQVTLNSKDTASLSFVSIADDTIKIKCSYYPLSHPSLQLQLCYYRVVAF